MLRLCETESGERVTPAPQSSCVPRVNDSARMGETSIKERIIYRRENEVDPEEFLLDVGAIEPFEGDEELRFTADFSDMLGDEMEQYIESGVAESDLARLFGVPEEEVNDEGRSYKAYKIINTVYKWPSEAAVMFDVAVDAALRTLTDDWEAVPPKQRHDIAKSLRTFQDFCYFCGGEVITGQTLVESCCSERGVVTLHCTGCERRFLEFSAVLEDN